MLSIQKTRTRLIAAVAIVALVIVALLLFVVSRAPAISTVAQTTCVIAGDTCLRFPTIDGENLSGQAFTLPADLVGDPVLVIVPFDEAQQQGAASWLPLAQELAAHPGFAYYNVAVFPDMNAALRVLIRTGMNVAISDDQLRALTITVFLDDRDPLLAALHLADADSIGVYLLNPRGEVLWQGSGEFSDDQGAALRALVNDEPIQSSHQ